MPKELTFVRHTIHRGILEELSAQLVQDPDIIGILLMGSVARGDALPGSDLDLSILLRDGCRRDFRAEYRKGILIEWKYADFEHAKQKLEQNSMDVYGYLDGRILFDPHRRLAQLKELARHRFETYAVPSEEKQAIAYWLTSSRIKMLAARDAGNLLKAAYVAGTTSWKMLEGLWAVNGKPIPPCGAV